MSDSRRLERRTLPPRLRSRAVVPLALGVIGLGAAASALVQYRTVGTVSIRPAREAVAGAEALRVLAMLAVTSSGFCAFGLWLLRRARRISASLREP